jgi:hypothetical protein
MSERDASFEPKIKEVIAGRAGYRCSFPGCDESTIGPGAGPEDIERKGVAAHIFSASTGTKAPRGTGGLSAEERAKAANGLWLCQDHGKIVDTDKGKNYPATQLQAWKALQEYRIAREVQKVPVGKSGWLERITIEESPVLQRGATCVLGKVTLIVGRNGVGKSALCEWVSGCAGNPLDFWRWSGDAENRKVKLRLGILAPDRVEFSMSFDRYNTRAEYGGKRAFDVSHLLRVFYVTKQLPRNAFEDDLEYLARMWRIHPYQVSDIVDQICSSKYGNIRRAEFRPKEVDADDEPAELPEDVRRMRNGRPAFDLRAEFTHHKSPIFFRTLSGSEVGQILISGAMVLAEYSSLHQSALLLLDIGANFDDTRLSMYTEMLQRSDFRFQTILVSPSPRPRVDWTGWSIARLVGNPPAVTIDQTVIADDG